MTEQAGRPGFTKYPNWLHKSSLKPDVREVYIALLSHDWNNERKVYPGIERIADMCALSRSTVKRCLGVLEAIRLITVHRRPPAVNHYDLPRPSKDQIEWICSLSADEISAIGRSSSASAGSEGTGSGAPTGSGVTGEPGQREPVDRFGVNHEQDEREEDEDEEDEVVGWAGASARLTPQREEMPPPAEPEGQGEVPGRKEISRAVSSANYNVDAEATVSLWEELRGAAPRPTTRQSWLKSATHLLEDGHPVEEILGLIRWVVEDDYWSTRIASPYDLRLDRQKRQRYADLLAESKTRRPKHRAFQQGTPSKADELVSQAALASLGSLMDSPTDAGVSDYAAAAIDTGGDFGSLRAKLMKSRPRGVG